LNYSASTYKLSFFSWSNSLINMSVYYLSSLILWRHSFSKCYFSTCKCLYWSSRYLYWSLNAPKSLWRLCSSLTSVCNSDIKNSWCYGITLLITTVSWSTGGFEYLDTNYLCLVCSFTQLPALLPVSLLYFKGDLD